MPRFLLLFLLVTYFLPVFGDPISERARQAMEEGDPEKAQSLLEEALASAAGAEDSLQLYYEWGKNFWKNREYVADLSYAEMALLDAARFEKGSLEATPMAHYILGMLYVQQRDHLRSREHYEQVIAYAEGLGELRNKVLARTYHFLGKQYTRLGDYPRALSLFQASLGQGDPGMTAVNYLEMGTAFLYLKAYDRAEEQYLEAIATGRLSADEEGAARDNLANTCMAQGRFEEALAHGRAALALFRNVGHQPFVAASLKTLGDIYRRQGRPEMADKHYQQALELAGKAYATPFNRETAKIYVALGGLWLERGNPEAALAVYQEALRCVLGGNTSADPKAKVDPEQFYPENVIMEALEGKASAFDRMGDLVSAMENYRLLGTIEDLLRLSYDFAEAKYLLVDESHRRTENALAVAYELYAQSGDPGFLSTGFELAERSRAMVLLESMKRREAMEATRLPDSLRAQEQALVWEITHLQGQLRKDPEGSDTLSVTVWRKQLFALQQEQKQLEKYLEHNYPEYHGVKYDLSVVALEEVQTHVLETGQVMVEYFSGDQYLYAFVVGKDKASWHRFVKAADWDQRLNSFIASLASGKDLVPGAYALQAQGLYQELLAPLQLPSPGRLLLIPDGLLTLLPFEALLTGPAGSEDFRSLPYLLFSQEVSYAYSATLLTSTYARAALRPSSSTCFLGMAPGQFEVEGLAPLPQTLEEVEALQVLMGGKAITGSEATKSRFLSEAASCRVLHLSTHALGWDSVRATAWIAFAGKEPAEALLTLEELYGLHLSAELTVLSACETGAGTLQRGEGVLSLARGFTYAGSQSIVKTLWPVNAGISKRLLEGFYRHLSEGMRKDQALHQTKIDFLKAGDLPAFLAQPGRWAAFVAIGDMRPLHKGGLSEFWKWWLLGFGLVGGVGVLFFRFYRRGSKVSSGI